ncbi:MAG: response regulator, partial [Deferrisomatales bacterium]
MAQSAPLKALIVEDNPLFRTILREGLRARFPGLVIWEAEDLEPGRELIRREAPDLVFLDVQLPGGNGLDLGPEVCAANPGAAVLVCTTHDLPEYRDAAFACGATHFVPKGRLSMGELLEVVGQ